MSSPEQEYRVDKRQVRRAFDRAAAGYEEVALLQREVGDRLMERLELIRLAPALVVDAGAGTGAFGTRLSQRFPQATTVLLDLAPAMLATARRHGGFLERWRPRRLFVCGDAERLPLRAGCADLVVSNLMLQWCNDLEAALREFRRVLRPGGLLMFTTLGPDTLKELRASWQAADGYVHVNAFIDMHDVGDAMLRAGFADPVMDREDITLTYEDVPALMRELKALGAHNSTDGRPRGLTGRGRLARVFAAYEAWRCDGRLPATYEVIHGHGWATDRAPAAPTGEVHVPVSTIPRPGGRR